MTEQLKSKPTGSTWGRQLMRIAVWFIPLVLLVAMGIPLLLSWKPVRDFVINQSITGFGVKAETETGSFGWTPPTRLEGIQITSTDDQVAIQAKELRLDQAWWQLILSADELGHLQVQKPSVTLVLDGSELKQYSLTSIPSFSANLRDADFTLRLVNRDEPVIAVSGLNVALAVQPGRESYLAVDRGRLFDRRPLTPEMCDHLLQLLDPTLGDVVSVDGSFSLDVERLRVPLAIGAQEQLQQVDFKGVLHLHHVTTRAKTPLLRKVLQVAADMYGKQATDVVRVVENNEIHVEVREGRIHHDQIEFSFPEISPELKIQSRGSVGLNESLDLQLTIPEIFVADDTEEVIPGAKARFHVTGTIRKPIITRLRENGHTETTPEESS